MAVRERMVGQLAQVDASLAARVAAGLGLTVPAPHFQPPPPQQPSLPANPKPEVLRSPALSLFTRPGAANIRTRRVAILVADGTDAGVAKSVYDALAAAGAVPKFVGPRVGPVANAAGARIEAEGTFQSLPSWCSTRRSSPTATRPPTYSAPTGAPWSSRATRTATANRSAPSARARGCSPRRRVLPDPTGVVDPGLVLAADASALGATLRTFHDAIVAHRHWGRETDPPRV